MTAQAEIDSRRQCLIQGTPVKRRWSASRVRIPTVGGHGEVAGRDR